MADEPRGQPTITLVVDDEDNPYDDVEVRGAARGATEGAEDHIDRLASEHLGVDSHPMRQAGEQRITSLIEPSLVRHQEQG